MLEATISRAGMAEMLRRNGIAPTHQRIEIAQILFARPQHLSADQILAAANRQHAEVSKATVYNTLSLMVEHGMIREVIVDPNKIFYDSNTLPHHHLYDVETGELTDIDASGVNVSGLPPLPQGMALQRIDVVVRMRRGTDTPPT